MNKCVFEIQFSLIFPKKICLPSLACTITRELCVIQSLRMLKKQTQAEKQRNGLCSPFPNVQAPGGKPGDSERRFRNLWARLLPAARHTGRPAVGQGMGTRWALTSRISGVQSPVLSNIKPKSQPHVALNACHSDRSSCLQCCQCIPAPVMRFPWI